MVGLDVEGCGGEMRGREEKEKVLTGFMIADSNTPSQEMQHQDQWTRGKKQAAVVVS